MSRGNKLMEDVMPHRRWSSRRRRAVALFVVMALLLGASDVARAETAEEFYRGKTVRVLAGFDAAGAAGFLVQLISTHLGKHLAGHPSVVPQFMPGGGSIVEANYIYNAAPKDGTYIGTLFDNLPTIQVLDPSGVKFDARRYTIVGSINKGENGAMAIRSDSPVQTIEQAKTTEVMEAVTGPGTTGFSITNALNKLLGTRFKLVMGYAGGGAMLRAFEQHEIAAVMLDYNSFLRDSPAMIQSGLMKFMFQVGDEPDARIADVPMLQSVAWTPEERAIFMFLSASRRLGKPIVAPPGVPPERVAALQEAWQSMLRDPAFIADAAKIGSRVEARTVESVQAAFRETIDVDPAIAQKAAGFAANPN
jgi:tripartite-type tricarboxylate transporter receptor subunit TctC